MQYTTFVESVRKVTPELSDNFIANMFVDLEEINVKREIRNWTFGFLSIVTVGTFRFMASDFISRGFTYLFNSTNEVNNDLAMCPAEFF